VTFTRSAAQVVLALVVAGCSAVAGCSSERDLPDGEGAHPVGWPDKASAEFHGSFLRDNGFDLLECRGCHGDDFRGGPVDVPCASSGCHTGSIDRCGTCHGAGDDPRPVTGAHDPHADYCETCHPVPDTLASAGHLDGNVDLVFSGLAVAGGATPSWDGVGCEGVYCHGGGTPSWNDSGPLGCNDCHSAPPDSHVRFARVATETQCTDCHANPSGSTHLDGTVDLKDRACNACHGGPDAAPPVGLDGETSPFASSVGAHVRHLDATLSDRIGKAVQCASCHPVPEELADASHLDTAAPSDVTLELGGSYDAATQTCSVWCHWDKDPGPRWTDASGAATACNACHGFPPVTTRAGAPHEPALPSECAHCHFNTPLIHVNGTVNF